MASETQAVSTAEAIQILLGKGYRWQEQHGVLYLTNDHYYATTEEFQRATQRAVSTKALRASSPSCRPQSAPAFVEHLADKGIAWTKWPGRIQKRRKEQAA